MKVIVFGASRGVGRAVTEVALAEGHRVTAAVRDPESITLRHAALEVVSADVTDADSVRSRLDGHEMVFCTVGAETRGATTLYSEAAQNVAGAMEAEGLRRLMFLSNFGVLGESGSGVLTAAMTFMTKQVLRGTLADHRQALDALRSHDLDWIAVRPMGLTDGPRSGDYRITLDGLPRGGTRISRADVADFMIKQVQNDEYVHRIPAIAY